MSAALAPLITQPPQPRSQLCSETCEPPTTPIPTALPPTPPTPTTTAYDAFDQNILFEIPPEFCGSLICADPPVYALTAQQYAVIYDNYLSTPLPNNILFPWMHGVDGRNYQQNLFFGIRKCNVPRHRGLTIIHADETSLNRARLVGSVLPNEVLAAYSPMHEHRGFLSITDAEVGINLRNFKIQVPRYATISDVVVYGEMGVPVKESAASPPPSPSPSSASKTMEIAKQVSWAQIRLKEQRVQQLQQQLQLQGGRPLSGSVGSGLLEYRTFVITDHFTEIERNYPECVGTDSKCVPINKIQFWDQEREEMRMLTKASEITRGVWLGNTQDVPTPPSLDPADSAISLINDSNPHNFSICIEAHDLAEMPTPSTLTLARETLNELPVYQLPSELIHLDVLASGSSITTRAAFDVFMTQLHHLLLFIDDQITRGRQILLHCTDGYTETSLLGLSWIIWKRRVRLPEAYLILQEARSFFVYAGDLEILKKIEAGVWEKIEEAQRREGRETEDKESRESKRVKMDEGNDSEMAKAFKEEVAVAEGSASSQQQQTVNIVAAPTMTPSETNPIVNGNASTTIAPTHVTSNLRLDDASETSESDLDSSHASDEDDDIEMSDAEPSSHPPGHGRQLYDDAYLSIVPSLIAADAANHKDAEMVHDMAKMEKEVNVDKVDKIDEDDLELIKEIVSVPPSPKPEAQVAKSEEERKEREMRERFPWFYSPRFEGSFPSRILPFLYLGNLNHATNPTMLKALGITHVLSVGENANLPSSEFRLLFLENLYDDGIDSLWSHMDECIKFIESARLKDEVCLIHCRVGVSRSATITIAYIMHRMHMPLVQAYLFVRARRLNVIIQPNLKFMYELLQYEQRLRGSAGVFWGVLSKEIHALNMCYREV